MDAAIAVNSETVSFVVSLLSCDVLGECSISEGLGIVPLTRHRFRTKIMRVNSMAASMHASMKTLVGERKSRQRDGLILVGGGGSSHRKCDILESFVCSYYVV